MMSQCKSTLISCSLDFCNSLFHCLPFAQISKLQRIQNSAARLVTRSSHRQHITPVLRSLHWLPVSKRIEFKLLLLTNKSLDQSAPHYLQEILHPYVPHRTLRSSSTSQLVPYITRTKSYGHRPFSYSSPSLWNNLPHNIRTAPNENIFNICWKNLPVYSLIFVKRFATFVWSAIEMPFIIIIIIFHSGHSAQPALYKVITLKLCFLTEWFLETNFLLN